MAGAMGNIEKNKFKELFFNEMSKPTMYRDKYLILFCYRVFKFSANDPILIQYIKSKFSSEQYNKIKQIIMINIQEDVPLDEIYKLIKSVEYDDKIKFEPDQINKEDEILAYRIIISESDFKANEIYFDILKKYIESNLHSNNFSRRDMCEINYTLICHQIFMDKKNDSYQDFKEAHRKRLILYFLVAKYGWGTGLQTFKNLKKSK